MPCNDAPANNARQGNISPNSHPNSQIRPLLLVRGNNALRVLPVFAVIFQNNSVLQATGPSALSHAERGTAQKKSCLRRTPGVPTCP